MAVRADGGRRTERGEEAKQPFVLLSSAAQCWRAEKRG